MAVKTYSTTKNVKLSKHFMSNEFMSHVSGMITTRTIKIDTNLIKKLEKFFNYGIDSVAILSGYRDSTADKKVGGNGSGAHTKGIAADIVCYRKGKAIPGKYIACLAQLIGFCGIGITGPTGCHVDIRTTKNYTNGHWWGDETNGNNYIKDFFKYSDITKAELFGYLEYYKEKCYMIKAKKKSAIYYTDSASKIKKYYPKGKKARVWAEKNGRAKVLSGWIKKEDIDKI